MLFDVQAALAEILESISATPATPATSPARVAGVAEVAGAPGAKSPAGFRHYGKVADAAGAAPESFPDAGQPASPDPILDAGKRQPQGVTAEPAADNPLNAMTGDAAGPTDPAFPYGFAPNGNPRTWTGRIVSLDDWRRLSAWERHGSTGQLWSGITRQWVPESGR